MEANDQIQAAADYLAPSGSLPICRLLKKHLDPKETYGDSWAGDSTVSFQVKSFRLTRDAGTSAMEPFSGMLHDKKHRLSIESYTVSETILRKYNRLMKTDSLVAGSVRTRVIKGRLLGTTQT